MRFTRLLIAAGTAALVLVVAPIAGAAAPQVTLTPWNSTRTIAASPDTCPFPIVVHSEGTFRESVYSDGRDVTTVSDFHITWTNPENGKAIHSVLAGPVISRSNGDGTSTVTVNGNDALFTGPGIGVLFADVGRLVTIVDDGDPNAPPVVLQSTGHQDTALFPAVCAALA